MYLNLYLVRLAALPPTLYVFSKVLAQGQTVVLILAGGTRAGALAITGISILGITKLNLAGPGLTPTIKKLWHTPVPQH